MCWEHADKTPGFFGLITEVLLRKQQKPSTIIHQRGGLQGRVITSNWHTHTHPCPKRNCYTRTASIYTRHIGTSWVWACTIIMVNIESLALPAMLWLLHCDLKLLGGAVPGAAEEQSGDVLMASWGDLLLNIPSCGFQRHRFASLVLLSTCFCRSFTEPWPQPAAGTSGMVDALAPPWEGGRSRAGSTGLAGRGTKWMRSNQILMNMLEAGMVHSIMVPCSPDVFSAFAAFQSQRRWVNIVADACSCCSGFDPGRQRISTGVAGGFGLKSHESGVNKLSGMGCRAACLATWWSRGPSATRLPGHVPQKWSRNLNHLSQELQIF